MWKRLVYRLRKEFVRYALMLMVLGFLSYMVNATHRFALIEDHFSNPLFVWQWMLTMPLFLVYVYCISWVYDRWDNVSGSEGANWKGGTLRIALFMMLSFLHASIVQLMLLATTKGTVWIWNTAYLRKDYPFFACMLTTYLLLAYYRPRYKLLSHPNNKASSLDDGAHLWNGWQQFKGSHALLAYLRSQLPSRDSFCVDNIRFFDIVYIETNNRVFTAYLSNGERIVFSFAYGKLSVPILKRWFLKVKDRHFVNMLYVDLMMTQGKTLVLEETVREILLENLGMEKLGRMMKVSRYFEEGLTSFLNNRDTLPTDGWDNHVIEYGQQNNLTTFINQVI